MTAASVPQILAIVRHDQCTAGPTLDDARRELEAGTFDGIEPQDLPAAVAARAALILRRTLAAFQPQGGNARATTP